jgi:hypothetical protein
VPYDEKVEAVIIDALRHPDAFSQDAGVAFQDYTDWLSRLDLLDDYPQLRSDLDAAMPEADLVLAMCAARSRTRVFSNGRSRGAVRRLTARLDDVVQRQAFEDLFPGDDSLEGRLERAYAVTVGDRNRFERGPETLFGPD